MGGRDVFISHSTKDAAIATDLCARLEKMGLQCWVAPRNVAAGASYGEEIVRGIEESVVVLLILSDHSNRSDAVRNEIERAFSKGKLVVPLRIRNIPPSKKLEFFISTAQWVDAYASPIEDRVEYIAAVVHAAQGNKPAPTPAPQRQGAAALLELWLERTLRHRLLASVVSVVVLAAIGLAGLAMQGATQVAVTGASVRVEKAAQGIEAASKAVGTINARLDDVNSNLKDVKRETSSDPRKELANRGVAWSDKSFFEALKQNDVETIALFVQGKFNLQSKNVGPYMSHTLFRDDSEFENRLPLLERMRQLGVDFIKDFSLATQADECPRDSPLAMAYASKSSRYMRWLLENGDKKFLPNYACLIARDVSDCVEVWYSEKDKYRHDRIAMLARAGVPLDAAMAKVKALLAKLPEERAQIAKQKEQKRQWLQSLPPDSRYTIEQMEASRPARSRSVDAEIERCNAADKFLRGIEKK